MKTFREILKDRNIQQTVVSEALGIHYSALRNYDNLLNRKVSEVITIHNVTGIPYNVLLPDTDIILPESNIEPKKQHTVSTDSKQYISIISNQQKTIENQQALITSLIAKIETLQHQ